MNIVMLLPASEIPEGSTVTKRTGSKPYTLQREQLRIYIDKSLTEDKRRNCEYVSPPDGGCFLIPEDGTAINAIPHDTILAWTVSEEDAKDFLEEREMDREVVK